MLRLGEILRDVFHHPFLARALALKGGTALNLAFGPPPRLSVDLDFNYVAGVEREAMLRDRPEVERGLERLALGRGYRVQRSRRDHAGRKFYLGYRNAGGSSDRIEIDLNLLFRLPLGELEVARLWQPPGFELTPARLVPKEELAAGKLCALLDRAEARDLYDAAHLPARLRGTWRSSRLRRLFIALTGILPRPLFDYGRQRFDRVSDEVVRTQLHPLLTQDDRPPAQALKDAAWTAIAPLVELNAGEREYCARLQAGELRPELLFPEAGDLADRVRRHPALLWKAENARRHAAGMTPR